MKKKQMITTAAAAVLAFTALSGAAVTYAADSSE